MLLSSSLTVVLLLETVLKMLKVPVCLPGLRNAIATSVSVVGVNSVVKMFRSVCVLKSNRVPTVILLSVEVVVKFSSLTRNVPPWFMKLVT